MDAKIVATYNNKEIKGEYIEINFDTVSENKVSLEMSISGLSANDEPIWEIYSNEEQLDTGDLTRGPKAELWILKTYAGTKERPHYFQVKVRDTTKNTLATKLISVHATPKITKAFWGDAEEKKITSAYVNSVFTAYFYGHGIYKIPLKLRFFLKSINDNIEDVEISGFAKTVYVDQPYDIGEFRLDRESLKENAKFFLQSAPAITMDYISKSSRLAITGDIQSGLIAKAYFTISYQDHILFNGKNHNLLSVKIDGRVFSSPEPLNAISPVVVYNEQYFTQKYEPCKYEKIFYDYKKKKGIEIFDEKKPTTKNKDESFKNEKFELNIIAPPRNSKNIKDLVINLEKVKTDNCSLLDKNKGQTNFGDRHEDKIQQPHGGKVFDVTDLQKANISSNITVPDESITIKPTFNYLYDKNTAWDFLKNYFLFSSTLSNTNIIENEFKGKLMDVEAISKGIVDIHKIRFNTCRYRKSLSIKTYADVAWAFHGFYNNPAKRRYYMDDESIVKREGLDEKITWVQNYNQYINFLFPMIPSTISDTVNDFVLLLLKDMASNYGLAFTAYYDFNDAGNCDKRIEYAEQYPNLFDGIIAGAVTLEILVQVLLLILTEGASAELLLARLSKAGVKMSGKLGTMAKKAEKNIEAIRTQKRIGTVAKVGHTIITTPSISYYKGYRYAENEKIGVQPLLEERMSFSPLFGIDHEHKKNLGDLVYEKTPVYKVIDLSQKAFEGLRIGFNRNILRLAGKETHEAAKLSDHYMQLIGDSFGKVNDYLSFVTNEMIKKVFGIDAELSVTIKGGYGMDFELKLHNEEKKLDLTNFTGGGNVKDASVATIGSNKDIKIEVKIAANVRVPVRAMNIINYMADTDIKNIEAGGKFEISTAIFIERRYFFHADTQKPYYKDSIIFPGVAGEYEYRVKVKGRNEDDEENIDIEQKSKKFILIPSQITTHKPVPLSEFKFTI